VDRHRLSRPARLRSRGRTDARAARTGAHGRPHPVRRPVRAAAARRNGCRARLYRRHHGAARRDRRGRHPRGVRLRRSAMPPDRHPQRRRIGRAEAVAEPVAAPEPLPSPGRGGPGKAGRDRTRRAGGGRRPAAPAAPPPPRPAPSCR
jgi:hypothetical protein